MAKLNLFKYSVGSLGNSFLNIVATVLLIAIAFNLSWFMIFIRLYSQLTTVKDINKVVLNLESWLLIGNLTIFVLFFAYALGIRNLRSILAKKYLSNSIALNARLQTKD